MATKTESVLGAELKIGDVVFVQGFRWRVAAAPRKEVANLPACERYSVALTPADATAAANGPRYQRWTSGLRVDLRWTREAAA